MKLLVASLNSFVHECVNCKMPTLSRNTWMHRQITLATLFRTKATLLAKPDIRARFVAHEVNTYKTHDGIAAIPPLKRKRLLLSHMASKRKLADGRAVGASVINTTKLHTSALAPGGDSSSFYLKRNREICRTDRGGCLFTSPPGSTVSTKLSVALLRLALRAESCGRHSRRRRSH